MSGLDKHLLSMKLYALGWAEASLDRYDVKATPALVERLAAALTQRLANPLHVYDAEALHALLLPDELPDDPA